MAGEELTAKLTLDASGNAPKFVEDFVGKLLGLDSVLAKLGSAAGLAALTAAFGAFEYKTLAAAAAQEKLSLQVASFIRQADSWQSAMARGADIVERLDRLQFQTGESTETLAAAFRSLSTIMGGTDEQLIGIIERLSVVGKLAGSSAQELENVIARAAFTGQVRGPGERQALIQLGLSPDQIRAAYLSGQLFEYLRDHLKDMTAQADALASSWDVLLGVFRTGAHEIMEDLGAAWEPFKELFISLREAMKDEGFRSAVRDIAYAFRQVSAAVVDAIKDFGEFLSPLKLLGPELKVIATILVIMATAVQEVVNVLRLMKDIVKDFFTAGSFKELLSFVASSVKDAGSQAEVQFQNMMERLQNIWEGKAPSGGPSGRQPAPPPFLDEKRLKELFASADDFLKKLQDQTTATGAGTSYEKALAGINVQLDDIEARWRKFGEAAQEAGRALPTDMTDRFNALIKQLRLNLSTEAWEKDTEAKREAQLAIEALGASTANAFAAMDFAKRSADLEKLERQLKDLFGGELPKEISAAIDAAWTALGRDAMASFRQGLEKEAEVLYSQAETFAQGITAGLAKVKALLKSFGQDVADAVIAAFGSLQQMLSSTFFDVITGKVSDLKEVFKRFGEDILKILSDVFAKIVIRWLLSRMQIAGAPLAVGVGTGLGTPGLAAAGGYESGITGAGAYGIPGAEAGTGGGGLGMWGGIVGGVGLGVAGYGLSQALGGQTTGQRVGGGMMAAGGLALAAGAAAGAGLFGAAAAAVVIPVYGWIAAIVLVIVGAIVSALSKPPDIKVPVHVSEEIVKTGDNAIGQALLQRYGQITGGLAEIAMAGGGKVADILSPLLAGNNEFFRSQQVTLFGKNQEDIQKGWENYLKTMMPQSMLSFAFGREITGWSDKDKSGAQVYGVPQFGQIDFSKGVTPIVAMLQSLGFVNNKIQEIAREIDLREPEEFIKWLTQLVGIVVGLGEASRKLGRSYAEIVAEQVATKGQTPAQAIAEDVDNLIERAQALALLTGDDKLQKTEQFVQDVNALIAAEEEAIRQLNAMADAIRKQATGLREAADAALRTPAEQTAFITARISENFQKIKDATNPQDVQDAWNQFFTDMTTVINGLVARIQAIRGLIADIAAFQDQIARGPMADPNTNPFVYLAENAAQIAEATRAFQNSFGDQQVTNARTLFGLEQERYQTLIALAQRLQDAVESVNQSIDAQLFQIGYGEAGTPGAKAGMLYERLQDLFNQLKRATSPEEVTRLVSQIQGLGTQYLGLYGANDPNRGAAVQFIRDLLESVRQTANLMLKGWQGTTENEITSIGTQLQNLADAMGRALTTAQNQLTENLGLLDDAVVAATDKLGDFGDELTAQMSRLKPFVDQLIEDFQGLHDAIANQSHTQTVTPGGQPVTAPSGAHVTVNVMVNSTGDAETVAADAAQAAYEKVFDTLRKYPEFAASPVG